MIILTHLTYFSFILTGIDYYNVYLKVLIDTSSVHDLVPKYLKPIQTSPSLTQDSTQLDDERTEAPPLSTMTSSLLSTFFLPLRTEISKKRKMSETSTPKVQAIDLDDFKFDKVVMRE